MKANLTKWWIAINQSLWFIPSIMVVLAIALAMVLVEVDVRFGTYLSGRWPRILSTTSDGTRGILTAIAGSMMTVAGVIFSITIVTLSLAANQYTSRILRNFTRDRGNQLVLGFFVSIFVYCVVALRSIRTGGDFIPSVTVLGAIALSVIGIGFLIYFIHHAAVSVQATHIVRTVAMETISVIKSLYPELGSEDSANPDRAEDHQSSSVHHQRPSELAVAIAGEDNWRAVPARATGYVQTLDLQHLLQWAEKHNTVIRIERGLGEFAIEGNPLLSLNDSAEISGSDQAELNRCFGVGTYRTIDQDPAFGLRQIVDVALKALSPSMNDTTTAAVCVEYLTAIFFCLATRRISPPNGNGRVPRVILLDANFEYLLDAGLNELRQNVHGNVTILLRLLKLISRSARPDLPNDRLEAFWKHVCLIAEAADRNVESPADRMIINREIEHAAIVLKRSPTARLLIT